MRLSIVISTLLLTPAVFGAAPKIDLSHLGKKSTVENELQCSKRRLKKRLSQAQVYTSGRSEVGVRRNIELVKPKAESLNLPRLTPEVETNDTSALAFVDEALGIEAVKPWQKGTLAKRNEARWACT